MHLHLLILENLKEAFGVQYESLILGDCLEFGVLYPDYKKEA